MPLLTSLGDCLDSFVGVGFAPETVIDVGVATGSPEIYSRFPKSYYFLVEPLSIWDRNIKQHLKRLNGRHLKWAASDTKGTEQICVPKGAAPGGANLVWRYKKSQIAIEETVQVRRLDEEIQSDELGEHTLLKIDAQGSDARIIEGSFGLLPFVSVLVAETGFRTPPGQKSVLDTWPELHSLGFQLAWTTGASKNARGIGTQTDLVFVNLSKFNPWS